MDIPLFLWQTLNIVLRSEKRQKLKLFKNAGLEVIRTDWFRSPKYPPQWWTRQTSWNGSEKLNHFREIPDRLCKSRVNSN